MKTIYILDALNRMRGMPFVKSIILGGDKHGYDVRIISNESQLGTITEHDILIMWNRHFPIQHTIAQKFEAIFAAVLVFERAYIRVDDGQEWFAIGNSIHNSLPNAPVPNCLDNGERFASFNREIKPWKKTGKHILIASSSKVFDAQGFGIYAQPQGWDTDMCNFVHACIQSPIVMRLNPKNIVKNKIIQRNKLPHISEISIGDVPIEEDFEKYDVSLTVVYASGAIGDSILAGIPVYIHGPDHIFYDACSQNISEIVYPDNRQSLCEHIAWNQFSESEIASGFAFEIIIDTTQII